MRKIARCAAFLGLLICASPVEAQTVQQSGNVVPGHIAVWITGGVIADGGAVLPSVQQSGSVTAGHVATWATDGVIQDGGAVTANDSLSGGSTTSITSGQTYYCSTAGCATSAAIAALVPFTGTAANLNVAVATAPGAGQTITATLMVGPYGSLVATTVTCTISGASATSCSDASHQASVPAGQAWAVRLVSSGSAASTAGETFGLQFISTGPPQPTSPYVLQSGVITAGHQAVWTTNGVIQDGGVPVTSAIAPGPFTAGDIVYVNNLLQLATSGVPLSTVVIGPASVTNNNLPAFDGTTGKLLKDSGITSLTTGTGRVVLQTSPGLLGIPTAPTAAPGDNSTALATTAFVTAAIAASSTTCNGLGAFAVGTGSGGQCSTVSGAQANLSGVLTIAPPANSLTQGINITQTSPTSGSTTGPYAGNILDFTFSQAVASSSLDGNYHIQGGYVSGLRSNCSYSGASLDITGTQIGGYTCGLFAQRLVAGVNVASKGDKMTLVSVNYSNAVDTSGYGNYSLVTATACDSGCTTTDHVGYDLDVELTGTTQRFHGMRIALVSNLGNLSGSPTMGSTYSSAITVASTQTLGFPHLIGLSSSGFTAGACNPNACSPIAATGDWFFSEAAFSQGSFANLSNITFANNIFNFQNYVLQADNGAGQKILETITQTALGTTPNTAIWLKNTTAATSGNQQISPALTLTGQGWKTTATAASQEVDWLIYNLPVQGTANPTTDLCFASQVNLAGIFCTIAFLGNGTASVGSISAVSGFSVNGSSVSKPQGRLTLTANTPVMTASATAQTTLRYDCAEGGTVPYYNGTVDQQDVIASCEVTSAMQASSTGVLNANGVFDVWWVHSGANRICVATNGSGGGWASDTGGSSTARGTGYTQLDQTTRGYITNKNALANCYNGSTNYGSVPVNQATYLGTICTDAGAAGSVSFTFGSSAAGGGISRLCVWNYYNRRNVQTYVQDSTPNWSWTSATPTALNVGGTGSGLNNRVTFVSGVAEDSIEVRLPGAIQASSTVNSFSYMGFALNSTTTLDRLLGAYSVGALTINYGMIGADYAPQAGLNFIQAMQQGDGTHTSTTYGNSITYGLNVALRM